MEIIVKSDLLKNNDLPIAVCCNCEARASLESPTDFQKEFVLGIISAKFIAAATSGTLAEIVFQNFKRTFFLKKTKKTFLFKLYLYLCMETK
jgi:hypothetical protein